MSTPEDGNNEEEASSSPAAPAAAAVAPEHNSDDELEARKLVVLEQLTAVYGFELEAAEKAVDAVGPETQQAVKFIIENGLGRDQGGSVVPKSDCSHVRAHVKISIADLPEHPQNSVCSYNSAESGDPTQDQPRQGRPKSADGACPKGENWLCLECGVVRCSRYGNGHGLAHWKDTKKEADDSEGHCVQASLADLSVWCHECDSYIRDPLLDPILQKLEQLKFRDVELEPKKKKARPNSAGKPASLNSAQASEESSDDDKENGNNNNDEQGDSDDGGAAAGPSIIDIARAVARGMPYEFFQSEDEQELEYPFDELPTSLEDVANFIQSEKCRNIVILAGAGMSVASGIPDFRSADGLYATMNPDLLSCNPIERESIREDPTVALEQGMFLQNPLPCLELNREFILGTHNHRWKATLAHRFVELLHAKTGKLVRLYTQNIDGLEDQLSQLPRNKTIAVHGSMDRSECAKCGAESDYNEFCNLVQSQIKDLSRKDPSAPDESTPIKCSNCDANAVKPAIVLFRSNLPAAFFENVPRDILDVDLLIVIGTSLRVAPANSLVWRVPKTAMRLLVNREQVGWHLGMNFGDDSKRDMFAQGNCDSVLLELMSHLGWLNDLEPLVRGNKLPASSASLLARRLGTGSLENDVRNSDSS